MAKDDVLVINHHQANLQVKDRVNSMGVVTGQRTVISVTVDSEPIALMLDEGVVAKRAAEMFAQRVREQTEQISSLVKPSTAKARGVTERAFAKGKSWALRRYSGGRTGATPPVAGALRQFNHSGRLARSIVAAYVESTKEWRINIAANRWNVRDFRNEGQMQAAFQKWVDQVPMLKDASSDIKIQRAIRETFADVMQKQRMGTDFKTAQMRGKAAVELLQKASGAARGGGFERDDEEAVA